MKRRSALLAALASSLSIVFATDTPASCLESGGIGGTGARAESGIGGTGSRADSGIGGTGIKAEGGIGGTGTRAESDLGLVGAITGFGSICVNGVEVHYDTATPVTQNGQLAAAGALALGQIVAVRAAGEGAQARAKAIDIVDAAVGPVSAIDAAAGTLRVLGQPVRIEPSTVLGPGLARTALAEAGASLRVSGLRAADGTIVATRIDRAAPGSPPPPGGIEPFLPAVAQARFVFQGYVGAVAADGRITASGVPFNAAPRLAAQLAPDRLVRISGRTEADGTRVAERAEFLSTPLNPRSEGFVGAGAPAIPRAAEQRRGGSGRDSSGRDDSGREGSGRDGLDGGNSGPGRSERIERLERGGSGSDRVERPERIDRSGSGRPERPERVDRSGRRGGG